MGYRCDNVTYLSGKLTITRENVIKGLALFAEDYLPEVGFLASFIWDGRKDVDPTTLPGGDLEIETPGFCGEGSRQIFDVIDELYALTKGSADILFTWEGGEDLTGLRVRDGKVTKHEVVQALGDELED